MHVFTHYIRQHKLVTLFTSLFFAFVVVRYLTGQGDFNVYFASGIRYLEGAKIHLLTEQNHFSYPTVTALFFAPGTELGHAVAKIIYLILSFGLMLVGVRLINDNIVGQSPQRGLIFFIALLFSFRFFLDVYGNEQTDFLIFGLVILGAYFYKENSSYSALCWVCATALKANPLFLILVPIFHRKWKTAGLFLLLVGSLFALPDILKYGMDAIDEPYVLELPERVITTDQHREGKISSFRVEPIEKARFSYMQEFVDITFSGTGESWWKYKNGPLNQSLTRIASRYIGLQVSTYWILLSLCAIFALALLYLNTIRPPAFLYIMLCYSSFVLIGPMASKPHFVVVYPLLVYCWKNALEKKSIVRTAVMLSLSVMLGFTTSGILGRELADTLAQYGHIGILTLVLWLYSYFLVLESTISRS